MLLASSVSHARACENTWLSDVRLLIATRYAARATLTRAALQLLGGVLALLVNNVAAAPIVDVFTFTTSNQSMWREGGSAIFSAETPLVSKWGTYDGSDAEDLKMGGIAGKENQKVAGTGIDIPNPAYEAWKVAYDACRELFSRNTCINGQSAKKTCVPFVGCATTRPKVSGLGDEPDHTIRVPSEFVDTRTGMETHLLTSGQVGIIPWVKAFGGSIKIELPVKTTFEMPDILTSGTPFTIKTGLTLENGARITAETPFLKAGVDGLINMTNTFTGTSCVIFAGCDSSSSTQNFNPGRFGLVGVDTTKDHPFQVFGDGKGTGSNPDFKDALGVPGLTLDVVHPWFFPSILNTDGVHDPLTPQIDLSKPRLGDVTVFTLDEQLSGGTLTGSKLELDTNQQVMSLNASVTGIGEMSVGSPGFLSKSFSISIPVFPDPKIVTTLLDVGIGPRFGLQQEFDFTPDAWVRLEFDRPVTR